MNSQYKFVLSCDGGGIRGVMVYSFLREMERDIFNLKGLFIQDIFDLFVGTSVGGIIALLLAYERLPSGVSSNKIQNFMMYENITKFFTSNGLLRLYYKYKYSGDAKTRLIQSILPCNTLANSYKPCMVPSFDTVCNKTIYFSSHSISTQHITADVAANATSAAPSYFPSILHEINGIERNLIDGGCVANNPCECAEAEACRIWGRDVRIKLLSIGTGDHDEPIMNSSSWGIIQWGYNADKFADILIDGPEDVAVDNCEARLGDDYLRVDIKINKIALDDVSTETYDHLIKLGKLMYQQYRQKIHTLLFD